MGKTLNLGAERVGLEVPTWRQPGDGSRTQNGIPVSVELPRARRNLKKQPGFKASLVPPPPQIAHLMPSDRPAALGERPWPAVVTGRGREPGSALVLGGPGRAEGRQWAPEMRRIGEPRCVSTWSPGSQITL